jgi:hypothetical protein
MQQLLEDYVRRLKNITELINQLSYDEDDERKVRLITKRGCYLTFIAELERELRKL